MKNYIVNKNAQPTGEHEVHTLDCEHLPELGNQVTLGYHINCSDAVREARSKYTNVDGCFYCCNECHRR